MLCLRGVLCAGAAMLIVTSAGNAAVISDADIKAVPNNLIGSGNGTLDLILFGFAGGGGVNSNAEGSFDADDANTQMPTGGTATVTASYVTSIGELRGFYELNFPDGSGGSTADEIVLFVDLSETGQVNDIKVDDLEIVLNYSATFGDGRDNPAGTDIDSATQNLTGPGYSGGTLLSRLDAGISPKSLTLNEQGSGFGDWMIFTGINPFDAQFSDSDRVLFFWDSFDHDGGGDKVFISGAALPEPATFSLIAVGVPCVMLRWRRRRSK